MEDVLKRLQIWYARQCDGDWEHYGGVTIGTLDNPGWRVDVVLEGTELDDGAFDAIRDERDEHDWILCWKEGTTRFAAGRSTSRKGCQRSYGGASWADTAMPPDGGTTIPAIALGFA